MRERTVAVFNTTSGMDTHLQLKTNCDSVIRPEKKSYISFSYRNASKELGILVAFSVSFKLLLYIFALLWLSFLNEKESSISLGEERLRKLIRLLVRSMK